MKGMPRSSRRRHTATVVSLPRRRLITAAASLGACATLLSFPAGADDIDIFTGASAGTSINPRILIVLDNTSNWSAANQGWAGGVKQGQSELRTLKKVIGTLSENINVGLFQYPVLQAADILLYKAQAVPAR